MKGIGITIIGLCLLATAATAQVAINTSGAKPNNSAMLDVSSTSQGFLSPRMTESQRLAISQPATGLMVYQTDGATGCYVNKGTPASPDWQCLSTGSSGLWDFNNPASTIYPVDSSYRLGLGTDEAEKQLHLTGSVELPETTWEITEGIIYKNGNRFLHDFKPENTAGYNTFLGINAGNFTMSNPYPLPTYCSYNTGIGYGSLISLSTGRSNSAVGNASLGDNSSGDHNTAVGFFALEGNDTGSYNVAIGSAALMQNNKDDNTAVGSGSMANNLGSGNTAVGRSSMSGNKYGNRNCMIGYWAGYGYLNSEHEANNCVVIGYGAGILLDDNANNNILIGYQAGDNLTTGANNLIIGYDLNVPNGEDASYQMYLGGLIYGDLFNDEVGIGTTSPDGILHVLDNSEDCQVKLESNNGRPLLKLDANSTNNSEIQFEENGTYRGAIGYNNNSENLFFYEDGSMVFRDGQLGILYATPTYTLQLPNNSTTGVARAYSWTTYSDKRIKSGMEPLVYGLDEILKLKPCSYIQHPQASEESCMATDRSAGTETIGLIAQEVWEVIPEAVMKPDDEAEELWGMDYDKLVPVLINGIRELAEQQKILQQEIEALQKQNAELLKRLQ